MFKLFTKDFWDVTARLILRNKILILVSILLVTIFFSRQWENMRLAYSEANMLPDDHEVNITYNNFLKTFGEEGNLIVLGVKDSSLFTVEKLNAWNKLSEDFKSNEAVETVISIKDLQKLIKDTKNEKFNLEPFIKDSITSLAQIETLHDELFKKYPFYDNFLFNKETKTIRTAIYMDKAIVNTSERKDFVVDVLMLGYMGAMPAEGIYLVLARVGTIYYFLHFIVVLPVVGLLEKTDPIPMSISEPVLTGGADPSLARKDNEKI